MWLGKRTEWKADDTHHHRWHLLRVAIHSTLPVMDGFKGSLRFSPTWVLFLLFWPWVSMIIMTSLSTSWLWGQTNIREMQRGEKWTAPSRKSEKPIVYSRLSKPLISGKTKSDMNRKANHSPSLYGKSVRWRIPVHKCFNSSMTFILMCGN